jgi:Tfp pilus assembly protein PilE
MKQDRICGRKPAGVTLLELVLTTVIIVLLIVLVSFAFRRAVERRRLERCRGQLVETYMALYYYRNCENDYLPLGWHVAGPSVN